MGLGRYLRLLGDKLDWRGLPIVKYLIKVNLHYFLFVVSLYFINQIKHGQPLYLKVILYRFK